MGVGPARLHGDDRLHVAGGGGVHLGEDEAMGAATAELGFILSLDYAEGAEDVAGVGPRRAIETKVEYCGATVAGTLLSGVAFAGFATQFLADDSPQCAF